MEKSYKTCFSRISMGNDIFPLKRKIKKNKEFSFRGKTFLLPPSPLPSYPLSCCRCMCTFPPLFYKVFFLLHFTLLYISCSHWIKKKKNFFQSLFLCVFKLTLESLFSFPLINSRERLQGERRRAVSNV